MYLYHITTKENLQTIMRDGLLPKIGKNSKLVDEQQSSIYLCAYKDIPFWLLLLGNDVLFRVTCSIELLEKRTYAIYDEYISYDLIPAENIKHIHIAKPKKEHMQKLCLSYLDTISYICVKTARYYNHKKYDIDELMSIYQSTLICLNKLDYGALSTESIKKHLLDMGSSGEYTFCDTYLNTDTKLYQQLIEYPNDILTTYRKELYDYIRINLKKCLNVNTGGWTG